MNPVAPVTIARFPTKDELGISGRRSSVDQPTGQRRRRHYIAYNPEGASHGLRLPFRTCRALRSTPVRERDWESSEPALRHGVT
jgi:hypothetical protein